MIGDPVGYSFIPHFAIGISGGSVFVPIENINADPDTEYDLGGLAYMPVPSIGVQAKVSISKFELGLKVAGIPPVQLSNESYSGEIQSMVIGGKLRYSIIEKSKGIMQYGVSAGGFYEYTKGSLGLNMSDTFEVFADADPFTPGDEHVANLLTSNDFDSTWKGHTVGGEAQGNMKILFIKIFAGGRLSTSWGKATTSITGDVTVEEVYAGYVTANPTESIDVTTETVPSGFDFYGFGGLEFKIFPLVVGARGGYNFGNRVITMDIGARLQF
jgi:hypothetical protein